MNKKKNHIFVFIFLIIFIILIAVIAITFIKQFNLNIMAREVYNHNLEFNEFYRNLKGTELISLINFTIDYNHKEENKSNSIVNIEVEIKDDSIINMGAIVESGIDEFNTYLGNQNFKPIGKEFYDNGKISLMRYKLLDINSLNNEEGKTEI